MMGLRRRVTAFFTALRLLLVVGLLTVPSRTPRRLITAFAIIILIIGLGTSGLILIEGWPVFDALYMTVITLSTVGYGEIRPLTTAGRTFVMLLILTGVGTVLYSLTVLAEILIEEQIAPESVRRRRLQERVRRMRDHLIVCGYGRVGAQVAAELTNEAVPVLVVDNDPAALERCAAAGHAFLQGDATEDAVLREAGIERARGLVATTNSDANNVYVTLAARALRSDIFIVARMDRDGAADKLKIAGADRVISPYHLGGRRMAALVLRPAVVDFVDTVLRSQDAMLRLEEIQVRPNAALIGLTIDELRPRLQIGASVLAILKGDGQVLANPVPATMIGVGDVLIVMGTVAELQALERAGAGLMMRG